MTWTLEMLQVVTFIRNLEDNSSYKKMLRCRRITCIAAAQHVYISGLHFYEGYL